MGLFLTYAAAATSVSEKEEDAMDDCMSVSVSYTDTYDLSSMMYSGIRRLS